MATSPSVTTASRSREAANPAHAIFISYASKDAETADRLVAALELRGLQCWISSRDIPPGADYQGSIVAAIEAAPIMLLLLSRNASSSKEMPKETSIASRLNRVMVPVLIDASDVTGALSYQATSAQRLDLSADFDGGVDRLARGLGRTLGQAAQTERQLRRLALRRRLLTGLAWPLAFALLLAGAAGVWQFRPQLVALRDSLASRSGGQAGPPAAAPQAATQPPRAEPPTPEARVSAFVARYYAALSGPAEQLPRIIEQTVQDPVQFYGRPLARRTLIAQEFAYTQRWPDRRFTIRPDTLAVSCSPASACSASGVVDYNVRSAARHTVSSGAERFDMRVLADAPLRVTSINAVPIERTQPSPDTAPGR